MQGSYSFNLGLNQKRFNSTTSVGSPAFNLGATRGKGSSTRMLSYCQSRSANPSLCINQFIKINAPQQTSGIYIYSKNNTSADGFQVGEPITKDMENDEYTFEFDPYNYQEDLFPNLADFIDSNIVSGDIAGNKLLASYWDDWGNDIFDDWGFFYLYNVSAGKYFFPLINPQNLADGVLTTQTFNVFGSTFTIQQGYPVQGIFKFDISVNNNLSFIFGAYGNMGSDSRTAYENLSYPYTINGTNLTLYYLHNYQTNKLSEQFYAYFIPKLVSQNNTDSYSAYYDIDKNSVMSKPVNNGLIVYFSKRYDVKDWIINDLAVQN